jgi:hypothetical protein
MANMGYSFVTKVFTAIVAFNSIVTAQDLRYEHEGSLFNSVSAASCCVNGVVHEGELLLFLNLCRITS